MLLPPPPELDSDIYDLRRTAAMIIRARCHKNIVPKRSSSLQLGVSELGRNRKLTGDSAAGGMLTAEAIKGPLT